MNYYAVCALLARVYNYAGMHQEAFNETEIVINALCDSYGSKCFTFTPSYTLRNGNTKLYEEIIFCLSNDQLWTIYKPYYGGEMSLYLNAWSADDLFDDNSDIRKKLVTTLNYYPVSIKNVEASGTLANYSKDIIPMIRLGKCIISELSIIIVKDRQMLLLKRWMFCVRDIVVRREDYQVILIRL